MWTPGGEGVGKPACKEAQDKPKAGGKGGGVGGEYHKHAVVVLRVVQKRKHAVLLADLGEDAALGNHLHHVLLRLFGRRQLGRRGNVP